jgi:hypothetical protein
VIPIGEKRRWREKMIQRRKDVLIEDSKEN